MENNWLKVGMAGAAITFGSAASTSAPEGLYMTGKTPPERPAKRAGEASEPMTITEALLEAKLEAVEARTETKFAQLLGELRVLSTNVSALSTGLNSVQTDLATARTEIGQARDAAANGKAYIIGTGITLGAFILGIFAYGWQIVDVITGLVKPA